MTTALLLGLALVAAVLDVDSALLNDFTTSDAEALQRLMLPLQQWL